MSIGRGKSVERSQSDGRKLERYNFKRESNSSKFKSERRNFKSELDGRKLERYKLTSGRKRKSTEGDAVELACCWIAKAGFSLVSDQPCAHADDSGPVLYIRIATKEYNGETHHSYPDGESQWYLVPAKDLQTEPQPPQPSQPCFVSAKTSLSPVLGKMPSDILLNSVAVALLPRIYVLGGGFLKNPSRLVYSYDFTNPSRGWERRPNMMCPRIRPSVVAVDGKIYVFGGILRQGLDMPCGEVYDPESDRWEGLLYRSTDRLEHIMNQRVARGGHAVFMDEYYNKHLLVGTSRQLHTYHLSVDSMTVCEHLGLKFGGIQGAVVDGILYTFQEEGPCIIARDLRKGGQWFPEPVHGLSKGFVLPYGCGVLPFLFHIGNGRLCIVYGNQSIDPPDRMSTVLIVCSVVRVSQRTSPSSGKVTLVATLESFKRYIVPGNELQDCLVL